MEVGSGAVTLVLLLQAAPQLVVTPVMAVQVLPLLQQVAMQVPALLVQEILDENRKATA
jgi:hypothetical protein